MKAAPSLELALRRPVPPLVWTVLALLGRLQAPRPRAPHPSAAPPLNRKGCLVITLKRLAKDAARAPRIWYAKLWSSWVANLRTPRRARGVLESEQAPKADVDGKPKGASSRATGTAPSLQKVASRQKPKAARSVDDDDEMYGNSPVAQARNRERARCEAIMLSPAAEGRFDAAKKLAFETSVPLAEATELLSSMPKIDMASVSARRAARNPQIGPGGTLGVPQAAAIAASWDRAFGGAQRA